MWDIHSVIISVVSSHCMKYFRISEILLVLTVEYVAHQCTGHHATMFYDVSSPKDLLCGVH
jgi:hypothetical protein